MAALHAVCQLPGLSTHPTSAQRPSPTKRSSREGAGGLATKSARVTGPDTKTCSQLLPTYLPAGHACALTASPRRQGRLALPVPRMPLFTLTSQVWFNGFRFYREIISAHAEGSPLECQ